jgi:hypothetical protein
MVCTCFCGGQGHSIYRKHVVSGLLTAAILHCNFLEVLQRLLDPAEDTQHCLVTRTLTLVACAQVCAWHDGHGLTGMVALLRCNHQTSYAALHALLPPGQGHQQQHLVLPDAAWPGAYISNISCSLIHTSSPSPTCTLLSSRQGFGGGG